MDGQHHAPLGGTLRNTATRLANKRHLGLIARNLAIKIEDTGFLLLYRRDIQCVVQARGRLETAASRPQLPHQRRSAGDGHGYRDHQYSRAFVGS